MAIITNSVSETQALGARVASTARPGDVFALEGGLGTGKTEFVRGFVRSLSGEKTFVRSPTFSIVNTYRTNSFPVYHFDFYRLNDPRELDEIGFDDYVTGEGVCLIEWGTMFPRELPRSTHIVKFTDEGPSKRRIELDVAW